jgi:D-alanyl-D-alanine carboxypeptidase/D-alanyl-D-alanine-endopeptidase (penicillin-binding protein 4)
MKSFVKFSAAIVAASLLIAPSASAFDPVSAAGVFARMAAAPELSNPSVSLIDVSTGSVVFESSASSQRKPASTMKLLSAVATLKYLTPQQTFATSVSLGPIPDSLVVNGQYDPWMSINDQVATKMHRTSYPLLVSKGLSAAKKKSGGSVKKLKIYYNDLFSSDLATLKSLYSKRGVTTTFVKVTDEKALAIAGEEVAYSTSPPVKEIMDWFLLWSDNLISERMGRIAAKAAGNQFSDDGVAVTFATLLIELGIDPSQVIVKDASGLSRENKVTASVMSQLLYKIYTDPALSQIANGLPIGGKTGTLRHRYLETAPQAVGLIKAKTGTLTGVVSLAGYVESGDREYAFIVIADEISRTRAASDRARKTIDRYLGKIAAPITSRSTETSTAVLQ